MKKNRILLIAGICLFLILAAVVLIIAFAPESKEYPTPKKSASAEATDKESQEDESDIPVITNPDADTDRDEKDESLPPVVQIPDPDDTEEGLQFPCTIPGYDLKIEKMAAYTGLFVEDGSNVQVENVAMLMLHNAGDKPVEYTEISVEFEGETLVFQVTALPAGERMVVQEKTGKPMPTTPALAASALVVRRAQMEIDPALTVVDNGNNTLTVTNLTNQEITTVRVFYKYYMEQEDLYVGGIAFTVRITRLAPGGSTTVQPSHFVSTSSRVVMALTYEEEV